MGTIGILGNAMDLDNTAVSIAHPVEDGWFLQSNGLKQHSLGHRPRNKRQTEYFALKGQNKNERRTTDASIPLLQFCPHHFQHERQATIADP